MDNQAVCKLPPLFDPADQPFAIGPAASYGLQPAWLWKVCPFPVHTSTCTLEQMKNPLKMLDTKSRPSMYMRLILEATHPVENNEPHGPVS